MCYRKGSFSTLKMIQQIITTDNCDEPRRSLHLNWPNATLPLCVFHVLQEVWGWLYERQHGVSKDDRVQIMKLFRNLVCAHKVQGYERTYENIFNFLATLKYKNCVQYFEKLCELSKFVGEILSNWESNKRVKCWQLRWSTVPCCQEYYFKKATSI